jgi:lysozyme
MPNVSGAGLALVKRFEGFRSRPYRDFARGVWTIGYGQTHGIGPNSPPVSEAAASRDLERRLEADYLPAVLSAWGGDGPLPQPAVDGFASFVWNEGPGAVGAGTTVGKRLRAGDLRGAADAILAWDKAVVGGVLRVVTGLHDRRVIERDVILSAPTVDPFAHYTASELRWMREYDELLRAHRDADRRRVLRRVMTEQRKRIWHAAQARDAGGDGRGWAYANRAKRYQSLLARTR